MQDPRNNDNNKDLPARPGAELERFIAGIRGFRTRFYERHPETMQKLVSEGQRPTALMIACSDSRVDPALLLDAEPGDLFVVRNVANLVPPYHLGRGPNGVSAAIEYAVRDLGVGHIVVLGHAHCGGIRALLATAAGERPQRDFLADWVSMALDACWQYVPDRPGEGVRQISLERLRDFPYLVERAAIHGSLRNLRSYPWIREALHEGRLALHGWWFDLETGDLWTTDGSEEPFLPLAE